MFMMWITTAAMAADISVDRPSVGASASTVGAQVVQVETGLQMDAGQPTAWSLPTLLRVGLGNHVEARLDSSVFSMAEGQLAMGGLAPAVKATVYQNDALTLGVLTGASLPIQDAPLSPYATLLADTNLLSVNVGWAGPAMLRYAVSTGMGLPREPWSIFVETAGGFDLSMTDNPSIWSGTIQTGLVRVVGDLECDIYLQTGLLDVQDITAAVGVSYRFDGDD